MGRKVSNHLDQVSRALPLAMSLGALVFAVACGNNQDSRKQPISVSKTQAQKKRDEIVQRVAGQIDLSSDESLRLSMRLEGASGSMILTEGEEGRLDIKLALLMQDPEKKENPAIQIFGFAQLPSDLGSAPKETENKAENKAENVKTAVVADGARDSMGSTLLSIDAAKSSPGATNFRLQIYPISGGRGFTLRISELNGQLKSNGLAEVGNRVFVRQMVAVVDTNGFKPGQPIEIKLASPTASMLGEQGGGPAKIEPGALTLLTFEGAVNKRMAARLPIAPSMEETAAVPDESATASADAATSPANEAAGAPKSVQPAAQGSEGNDVIVEEPKI